MKSQFRTGNAWIAKKITVWLCLLLFLCSLSFGRAETKTDETTILEDVLSWMIILDTLELEKLNQYKILETPDMWFIVIQLPGNVFAFIEPFHEQCACAFLILGKDKALLLDTCTGIVPLRKSVEYFTDLPVTVLNSHDHFDHMGGNYCFDDILCYHLPSAVLHLTNGPTEADLEEILGKDKSIYPILKYNGYQIPDTIPGKAPSGTVEDGQIIDLGNRSLEVIHTPGHQPSCIMLLDRENKLLFTGDMFYPGPMYCMFDDSSFPDYVKSIRKAADLAAEVGIQTVYTSHNLPTVDTETFCRFADFLEGIESGAITEYQTVEGFRFYEMDEDISICLLDEGTEPISGFSMAP